MIDSGTKVEWLQFGVADSLLAKTCVYSRENTNKQIVQGCYVDHNANDDVILIDTSLCASGRNSARSSEVARDQMVRA